MRTKELVDIVSDFVHENEDVIMIVCYCSSKGVETKIFRQGDKDEKKTQRKKKLSTR